MSDVDEFDEVDSSSDEEDALSDDNDSRLYNSAGAQNAVVKPIGIKRKAAERTDSDDEDDEEEEVMEEEEEVEEEEEEDEEEEEEAVKRSKKKSGVSDFFLDEVEVDSDDEQEEQPEEGTEDEANEAEEAAALARMYARRRDRENIWKNMNDEEIGQYFKNKYSRSAHVAVGDGVISDETTQQSLLPTVKDPNLWMVKCRIGEEKLAVLHLMRKAVAMDNQGEPLQIASALAKEGLKGFIYVEASKHSHVIQAIEGISSLNLNRVQMVPIGEMTAVLTVVRDLHALKPGIFVRLKRTMYRDDLAQVDWIDLAQKTVHLKLIPRIDMSRMRGAMRNRSADGADAQEMFKRRKRPPAKLFDAEAVKAIGGEVSRDGDLYVFEGNRYSRKGFLYKGFPLNAIIVDGVVPSLTEVDKFQEGVDDLKSELANTLIKVDGHNFAAGDNVEVINGELANLQGKVLSVEGKKVTIMPHHPDLNEMLKFDSEDLRKFFRAGDHVRVMCGRYEGDTGLIVSVEPNKIILISDLNMQELQVLPKDVQLCRDIATGVDSSGQCRYEDLVQIDQQTVGVIIQIEREFLNVLNMHGKVVRVKQQALYGKKDTKFAVALDSDGNNISNGDAVNVIDGPHSGMKGEIRHVYRSYIFVHSKTYPRNGGLFVCRSRHLLIAGAKPTGNDNENLPPTMATPPGHSPILNRNGNQTPGHLTPHYVGVGAGRGFVMRDNSLIGKSVKIIRGPMKGYRGTVKDATPQMARVELHTVCKPVNVDRSHLRLVDAEENAVECPTFKPPKPVVDGGRTPMQGSATPMYGSMTPMHDAGGSRTPYYGSNNQLQEGSRTPAAVGSAWDPSIANTPARPNMDEDFGYDDSNTSSKYGGPVSVSPATPGGGYSAETPMGSVYTVDDMFSVFQPQCPYGMRSMASPSFSVSSSTSSTLYDRNAPSQSPVLHSNADWLCQGLEVLIRSDEKNAGKLATVRSVQTGKVTVELLGSTTACSLRADQLEPSRPQQADKIKVIIGEDKGVVGKLLSIDGEEGVVKTDTNDIRLYNMTQLCKFLC